MAHRRRFMKKFKLVTIILLLTFIILLSKVCDAYGFGFKKNYNNTKPDIGIYQNIYVSLLFSLRHRLFLVLFRKVMK